MTCPMTGTDQCNGCAGCSTSYYYVCPRCGHQHKETVRNWDGVEPMLLPICMICEGTMEKKA